MSDPVTPEQGRALEIARDMARAGIPIFVCPPNTYRPGKYYFKADWQNTVADPATIDAWQPGWGMAAVGGHAADFLDMDPRSGGIESQTELKNAGQWPLSFGQQSTPSGGTHDVISASGERKETAFMPGLDFQSGALEPDETGSHGRAFVWIAPTVGVSKATGELVAYRWVHPPDLDALNEWRLPGGGTSDTSIEGVVARVYAKRAAKAKPASPGLASGPMSGSDQSVSQLFGAAHDPFTRAEAERFLAPLYDRLTSAEIGDIEEAGMAFTLGIEHFVPAFWSAQQAYAIVLEGLKSTAYDPNGPSNWTADKFLARLDGRRPVPGSWKAQRRVSPQEVAAAFGQQGQGTTVPTSEDGATAMVDALLAEMLTPDQLRERPAPRSLIKGLLNLDSIAWVIGAPGSKKSFVVLDMAGHIVRGQPWQGLKVHQGTVVLIVAEGAGGMSNRVKAYESAHGAIGGQMRILPRPVQVSDFTAWQVLVEACRRLEPVLVVIDTQARVTVGLEENSARDMGIFIAAAERIREATGACVMPVHHTGRQGGDARGSSAIDGAQSTELKVIRQDAMTGALRVEKQKDLQEVPEMPLHFKRVVLGEDEDGDEVSSLVLLEANAYRDVAGAGQQGPQVYVPTFGDKDKWRGAILDALYLHAPAGGMTLEKLTTRLSEDYGTTYAKLKRNGTFTGAWAYMTKLTGPDGEPVLQQNGDRFEVGSLSVRAGLEQRFPMNNPDI